MADGNYAKAAELYGEAVAINPKREEDHEDDSQGLRKERKATHGVHFTHTHTQFGKQVRGRRRRRKQRESERGSAGKRKGGREKGGGEGGTDCGG